VGRLKRLADGMPGASRSLLETVRANPWPVALLAMAAVGLIVRALNANRRRPNIRRLSTMVANDSAIRADH
jgi:hypothetical protein